MVGGGGREAAGVGVVELRTDLDDLQQKVVAIEARLIMVCGHFGKIECIIVYIVVKNYINVFACEK